eukprot:16862-Chlamydomonas_euryale.AAC.5
MPVAVRGDATSPPCISATRTTCGAGPYEYQTIRAPLPFCLSLQVSNKNYLWGSPPMLKTFTDGFKRAGVSNHLILALDKDTFNWCEENNINVHLLKLEVRACGSVG